MAAWAVRIARTAAELLPRVGARAGGDCAGRPSEHVRTPTDSKGVDEKDLGGDLELTNVSVTSFFNRRETRIRIRAKECGHAGLKRVVFRPAGFWQGVFAPPHLSNPDRTRSPWGRLVERLQHLRDFAASPSPGLLKGAPRRVPLGTPPLRMHWKNDPLPGRSAPSRWCA